MNEEIIDKLYALAINAYSQWYTGSKFSLKLRMKHYFEADTACIAIVTGLTMSEVEQEVLRRIKKSDLS
jgi:hypothetical protein